MQKVLIVDDHPVVMKWLSAVLREAQRPFFVGEASNSDQAWEQLRSQAWDIMVLDISLPGKSGVSVLRELKREFPDLPVLMLSMHGGQEYVDGSLKAGASGYLLKESASEELIAAIETVLAGGIYISPLLKP